MKKTLIALAVAGFSFNAAALDLTATATATDKAAAKYASELNLPAVLTTAGNAQEVKSDLPALKVDEVIYVRYDFTNATLEEALEAGETGSLTLDGTYTTNHTVDELTGGKVGTNYAIFKVTAVTATGTNINTNATLTTPKLRVVDQAPVGVKVTVFDSELSAIQEAGAIKSAQGNLIDFAAAVTAKVETNDATLINVSKDAKEFVVGTGSAATAADQTKVGKLKITKTVTDIFGKDGNDAAPVKSSTLEIAGDFSAGVKKDGKVDFAQAFGGLTADAASTNTLVVAKDAEAATQLTFKIDGETVLNNQSITAKYVPVANDGYTVSAIDLGEIATIKRSGDEAEVNLALSAVSSFNQFVRVTNDAGVAATSLQFSVIDAAGQSANVALADIVANGSSEPVNVKALFEQAKAKNAELNDKSLLRIKVAGEASKDALSIESYTLSKDANSVNNLY